MVTRAYALQATAVALLLLAREEAAAQPLRSSLYPSDWTPAFRDAQGRGLQDYSYAGYRQGEVPFPNGADLPRLSVVDFSADTSGTLDATAAFQAAFDQAAALGGALVEVPEGIFRIDGLLSLSASRTIVRGRGPGRTHLWFTRATGMGYIGHWTVRGSVARGANLLLAADAVPGEFVVTLADASSLTVGEDVALGHVITPEFVDEHGMTGVWRAFNGTWQVMLRRRVVALEVTTTPHRVYLDGPVRYPIKVRDGASLRAEEGYVTEVGLEEFSLSTAIDYATAWTFFQSHAIRMDDAKDCWIRNVDSAPPPTEPVDGWHLQNGGIKVLTSNNVTLADCDLARAQNRGTGGSGYLFEISQSGDVLTRDCTARQGRHNFIQNWGFGATGLVWLRCTSTDGQVQSQPTGSYTTGYSEFHHSLATACLWDQSTATDGWLSRNRGTESTGAGHCATQCTLWNARGGVVGSWNYGWGYVIGTTDVQVYTDPSLIPLQTGTAPEDFTEALGEGARLVPQSLYEDQLARRLAREAVDGQGYVAW